MRAQQSYNQRGKTYRRPRSYSRPTCSDRTPLAAPTTGCNTNKRQCIHKSVGAGTTVAFYQAMKNETGELNPKEQKLDIFLRLPDGKPLWVESILGYEDAKLRLEKLIQSTPGDYFLFHANTGEIVRD
jgi:hypothetical protein